VIGTIAGRRPDELIVFSGHYDHVGIRAPVDGDSIANGANDNASGTTAVIELARYYHALGRPERTLVFVAFAAEEAGGCGSEYLADRLNPDEIVALFNIEMIGKVAAEGPNRAWITGWDESDFGLLLAAAVPDSVFAFTADPYPDERLFYRSDNAVFARLGVPAHSISTTSIAVDPDYHRVTDEVGTLDIDHITATIRAIAAGARPIVEGTATPTRVDPARLR
jgi:Zn-dependent M28 family amino/carboxypeptidase